MFKNYLTRSTQDDLALITTLDNNVQFLVSKDTLKRMRDLDDKIIHTLNTTVPTVSFRGQLDPSKKCETLYNEILTNYNRRESAIKDCISFSSHKIKQLKEETNRDELQKIKALKSEQTKLRLFKSELGVEEVIRDQTLKTFNERCRQFYKPANLYS